MALGNDGTGPARYDVPARRAGRRHARRFWPLLSLALVACWGGLFTYVVFYLSEGPGGMSSPVAQADAFPIAGPSLAEVPSDIMRVQRVLRNARSSRDVAQDQDEEPLDRDRAEPPAEGPSTAPGGTFGQRASAESGPDAAPSPPHVPDAPPAPAGGVIPVPVEPGQAAPQPIPQPAPPAPPAQEPTAAAKPEFVGTWGPTAAAKPEFVGTWGPTAEACGIRSRRKGYLPAVITREAARAGGTSCAFKDVRRNGDTWVMGADCTDKVRRWSSQVRLVVDGDRLTWLSGKGASTYVRCGRRP